MLKLHADSIPISKTLSLHQFRKCPRLSLERLPEGLKELFVNSTLKDSSGFLFILLVILLGVISISCVKSSTNVGDAAVGTDVYHFGDIEFSEDQIALHDSDVGSPVEITIATYNVKNFFDDVDDPTHEDDLPKTSAVEAKIKSLGGAIRLINADILALQEVENKALLTKLNTQELAGLGYKELRLIEGNDMRGIDVALLSKYSVTGLKSHIQDRFQGVDGDTNTYGFSRDCLEVTIEAPLGQTVTLLINHLRALSYGNDENEAILRRHAQANRVREISDEILKRSPDANLAIVGDLNDTPNSKTLSLIKQTISPLFNLLELAPTDTQYTVKYQEGPMQFDYILVAPGLKKDYREGSVKALHDDIFRSVSDHYPVIASFDLQ